MTEPGDNKGRVWTRQAGFRQRVFTAGWVPAPEPATSLLYRSGLGETAVGQSTGLDGYSDEHRAGTVRVSRAEW
jgi:hypothetical protein